MNYKGTEIKTKYKYIEFVILPQDEKKKTLDIKLINISSGATLALIKWDAPWRQYVMHTRNNIIFNSQCSKEIGEFLENINNAHRNARMHKNLATP